MLEQVFIITYCRNLELLYGSTLVFDSLRVGFPEARIFVVDNGSLVEAQAEIMQQAKAVDGEFMALPPQSHTEILRSILALINKPTAIVDPDIVFWDRADHMHDATLSGRLIPEFFDPYSRCLTKPRLHTSFWKINQPEELRKQIITLKQEYFEWDPLSPTMIKQGYEWVRHDTGASLYVALPDHCQAFSEADLKLYDHLFCGSHVDVVSQRAEIPILLSMHEEVKKGNHKALRGAWKEQDKFFAS